MEPGSKITWETLAPATHIRFIAISPRGHMCAWPRSRTRRAWMALRGWEFIEDSELSRRRFAWLRSPRWTVATVAVSKDEIERRWGA